MDQPRENSVSLKEIFRTQKDNWIIATSHKANILLFIAGTTAIFVRWSSLPALVPLWYAQPWGTERLAAPFWLFVLPTGSILWHMVNTYLALTVTREYLVFTQLLFITSFLVSALSFITLAKILLIVT